MASIVVKLSKKVSAQSPMLASSIEESLLLLQNSPHFDYVNNLLERLLTAYSVTASSAIESFLEVTFEALKLQSRFEKVGHYELSSFSDALRHRRRMKTSRERTCSPRLRRLYTLPLRFSSTSFSSLLSLFSPLLSVVAEAIDCTALEKTLTSRRQIQSLSKFQTLSCEKKWRTLLRAFAR